MLGSKKPAGGGGSKGGIVEWMLDMHPFVKVACVMAIVVSGLILFRLAVFDNQITGDTAARTERARIIFSKKGVTASRIPRMRLHS